MKTFLIIIAIIVASAVAFKTFEFNGKIDEPGMTKDQMQKNFENKPYLNR